MLKKTQHWLETILRPGNRETQHYVLLNVSLLTTSLYLGLVIPILWLDGSTPKRVVLTDLISLILTLGLYFLLRKGKVEFVRTGVIVVLFLWTTAACVELGTIRTPVSATYLLMIIFAGWLFGPKGTLACVMVDSLAIMGLIVAENAGLLIAPDYKVTFIQWFTYTGLFVLSGGLSFYNTQITQNALLHAEAEIAERKRIERQHESLLEQVTTTRDELAASQDLLKGILERVSDGFVAFDKDLNYTYVNAYGGELLGRRAEDLIGKNYWTEYPEARGTPFANAYVRAMELQQPIFLEDYYVHWDRWFVNRIYPSTDGITIFFSDVTERKRSEQLLRRLNRELRAVSECNQVLIRAENEQSLLNDICRIICEEAGYTLAWVGYAEQDDARTVRPVAWAGKDDGYLANLNITWADTERGRGPTGASIRTGRSIYIQDFETEPTVSLWRENALARGYRSSIALPLKDKLSNTFGALMIYSTEPNAFSDDERKLLDELAADLAFGITVLRERAQGKSTEELLRKSEAKFRAVVENSNDGILFGNANAMISFRSPSYNRINGYSDEERVGHSGFETVHPEDQTALHQYWTQVVASPGVPLKMEYRIRHKDGSWRWIDTTSTNLLEHPDIREIVVTSRDITDRKYAEAELHKLYLSVEQSPASVVITDTEGNIEYVNPKFTHVTGYSAEEVIGKNPRILKANKTTLDEYRVLWQTIKSGQEWRGVFHNRKKNGELFWESAVISPIRDEQGRITNYLAVKEDITHRKEAEEALHTAKTKLETMIGVSPLATIMLDLHNNVQLWNPAAEKIFGWQAHEVLGRPNPIIPGSMKDEYARLSTEVVGGNPLVNYETLRQRKDGSLIHVSISSASLFDPAGNLTGRMAIAHDITERKQRERELQAIATLSAAMRAAPTRAEMLPVIVGQLVDLFPCDAVAIEIIDSETGESVVEAAHGSWNMLMGSRQEYGDGLNGIITRTRRPYITQDLKNDDNLAHSAWAHRSIGACAGVPLITQGQLIGFIWIGRRDEVAANEVDLLSAVANIAANAIHRTTLHEQTQKNAEELARNAAELALAYDRTLEGWANTLEMRDPETEGHTRRVVATTLALAQRMGISEDALENVRRGALLHDIGKMGVPDSVLLKPSTLTEREWEIMRRHPEYAYNLLSRIEYLRPSLDIPYSHHERWDGTGYPRGLKGEEIPLPARIFAVVDVWDALTNDRPYRPAWSHEKVMTYICEQSGKHFDPEVVQEFLKLMK